MTLKRLAEANVFVLPDGADYIVFAPIRGLLFRANEDAICQLQECCRMGSIDVLGEGLRDALQGGDWLLEEDQLQPQDTTRDYEPAHVTLFLTNRCNLRCSYCYAEAGDRPGLHMDTELCKAAIDYSFAHVQSNNMPLTLGIHGGGEPTLAWDMLTWAATYAESITRDYLPGLRCGLTTNGILTEDKIAFIAEHCTGVTLSLDGPEDIQNLQRPMADGEGSFQRVMATVAAFHERKVPFAVRATVTRHSVGQMTELVDFFTREVKCNSLQLEPAFGCGRCAERDEAPDYDEYAEQYLRAFDVGLERGVIVRYSAAGILGRKLSFCGVAHDSFNITPDGYVTSCLEVCDATHPLADEFIYGRYDRDEGVFIIDYDRLQWLRALVVTNKSYCDTCICRWHCAGDCPVRVRGTQVDYESPSPRCSVNQRIMKGLLKKATEKPLCTPREMTSS